MGYGCAIEVGIETRWSEEEKFEANCDKKMTYALALFCGIFTQIIPTYYTPNTYLSNLHVIDIHFRITLIRFRQRSFGINST